MPPDKSDIEALSGLLARVGPKTPDKDALLGCLERLSSQRSFLDYCTRHGMAPLVYRNLKRLGLKARIDDRIWASFERIYYRTLADNLQLFEALRTVAREADRHRIPLIVLKGPALVHLVYGDPGLRSMTDIDLLVRPPDVCRLKEIVTALGYTPVPLYPDLFQKGETVLDLHTDPINRSRIEARGSAIRLDQDRLWQSAHPLPGFDPLLMLGLTDQILTLSVHALKHGYQQNNWLVDIAGCIGRLQTEHDWKCLQQQARESGTSRILALTLFVLQNRLGEKLPTPASAMLKAFRPDLLERLLMDMALQPGTLQLLEPLTLLRTLKGTREKVTGLLEMAFPRPEVMAQISGLDGPRIFWLSYLHRLAQLVGMAGKYLLAAGRTSWQKSI